MIDYDEFLTGNRAEATYTMFKSFLPKVAAIPASAIPVALLNVFGHVPPIDGVIQRQTAPQLRAYIKIAIIIIPTLLSISAFVLKLRFPIRSPEQNSLISAGIGLHAMGKEATDPISQHAISLVKAEQDELEHFNRCELRTSVVSHLLTAL